MAFTNDDFQINSIIGIGSSISGDIKVNGFVRVDGDIDGNLITTGNVNVGEKARVLGNIQAKTVTVNGIVKGNIIASQAVQLLSKSVVIGDITTRKLKAEENVILHGHCIALTNDTEYEEACDSWQNVKAITNHSILQSIHVVPSYSSFSDNEVTESPATDISISEKTDADNTPVKETESVPVENAQPKQMEAGNTEHPVQNN